MSIILADKYDIKNSALPKNETNYNALAFRENILFKENFAHILVKNYSNIGWVFGMAQYGITPITLTSEPTYETYALIWQDSVCFYGTDEHLIKQTSNVDVAVAYLNTKFIPSSYPAYFDYLLDQYIYNTGKFYEIVFDVHLKSNEKTDVEFTALSDSEHKFTIPLFSDPTQNRTKTYISFFTEKEVGKLTARFNIDNVANYNYSDETTITESFIYKLCLTKKGDYDYIGIDFSDDRFIDWKQTTATISENRIDFNQNDELVFKTLFVSLNRPLKGFIIDFTNTDTNINLYEDKLEVYYKGSWVSLSPEQNTYLFSTEMFIDPEHPTQFPLVFPYFFGGTSEPIYELKIKIVASDTRYIDTTKGHIKLIPLL